MEPIADDASPPVVARVTVEPLGVTIEVRDGEDLLEAAQRLNYRWPNVCNGQAECATCRLKMISAVPEQAPPNQLEQAAIRRYAFSADSRLACQLHPLGDLRVFKAGVRVVDPGAANSWQPGGEVGLS